MTKTHTYGIGDKVRANATSNGVYDKPGMGWLTVDTTLIIEDTDAKYGV